MEPVVLVNVDIAFLANFVTDLAWLWVTSRLAGVRASRWRLAATAAVGAGAAVWAYFPGGRWLVSGPGAVAGTALLLALAYAPCRVRDWARAVLYFLLSGGAMAGVSMLISYRVAGAGGVMPGALVAVGICLCYAGGARLWEAARLRGRLARSMYSVRVRVGEKAVELPALLDTGNGLKDPVSGTPVVLAEAEALAALLPETILHAVAAGWDGLERLPPEWAARCRLVPFRSVGRAAGVLLALAPDDLAIKQQGGSEWVGVRCLVGLAGARLHPEGAYRVLLSPATLETAAGHGTAWEGETG